MDQKKLEVFEAIFNPQSIAIVGASADERKSGSTYMRHLLKAGFRGKVYPVNPSGGQILGLQAYPSMSSIPEPVDYVSVHIGARFILNLLEDCAANKAKVVQLFTAGFAESGEEGRRLENEIAKKARQSGIRIIGPNCIGAICPKNNTVLARSGDLGPFKPGPVAFISQSGGQTTGLLEMGLMRGIGFSKVVSFGNACDLDSADFLEYLAFDQETQFIGAYLEGVKDGRRLFQLIKEISKTRPIVIWKAGRTEAGARAAASHTGALAASSAVWLTALRQAGAVAVESLEEMADTLLAFQHLPALEGNRVGIITGGGGGGGMSVAGSDACASQGLEVPLFAEATRAQLKAILPPVGSILINPVDMTGSVDLETAAKVVQIVASDVHVDVIIVYLRRFLDSLSGEEVGIISKLLLDLRKIRSKPLVVFSPPGTAEVARLEIETRLSDGHIPCYPTLERTARAIMNVARYWRFKVRQVEPACQEVSLSQDE